MMFCSKLKIKTEVGRLIRERNNYLEEVNCLQYCPSHTANVVGHKVGKDSVKVSVYFSNSQIKKVYLQHQQGYVGFHCSLECGSLSGIWL